MLCPLVMPPSALLWPLVAVSTAEGAERAPVPRSPVPDQALHDARMAIVRDPSSVPARLHLAELLLARGEYQPARQVAAGAIGAGVDDPAVAALLTRIDSAYRQVGPPLEPAAGVPCQNPPSKAAPQEPPVVTTHGPELFDSGKLLATAGISQLEGAGGGGLATWSFITGYESEDSIGANGHYTYVGLPDFTLNSAGAALGLYDRVELSYARERFDTGATGKALGLGQGFTFDEDVVGAKVRLFGNAVYDQDSWTPQIAAGIQYKSNNRADVIDAVHGRSANGIDYYLAATKLFLSESLLLDATVRATKANQFGILGFGGDRSNGYQPEFEGSAAVLLTRAVAVGAEFRTKPDNLLFAEEDNAYDFFAAWFLNKHLSATVAYVDLGDIATRHDQNGVFLSFQAGL